MKSFFLSLSPPPSLAKAPPSWIWILFCLSFCLCGHPQARLVYPVLCRSLFPSPRGTPGVLSMAWQARRRHRRCPSSTFPRAHASLLCPPNLDRTSPLLPVPSRPALAARACRLVAPPGSLPAAHLPAGVLVLFSSWSERAPSIPGNWPWSTCGLRVQACTEMERLYTRGSWTVPLAP